MKLRILILLVIVCGCSSKDKIRNIVEARIFLANHEWHDSRASFITLDGESHTAGSSVKFTVQEVISNNQTYTYRIEKKPGGDSNSHTPYYEISWFDNYLNEEVKFYLNEDGGGYLISTRWKLNSYDNVGKPIAHVSEEEALQKEKEYQSLYYAYEAARTTPASDDAVETPNLISADMYVLESDTLISGTIKYCDLDGMYSLVVKIEGSNIIIEKYAGEKNQYNPDKNTPQDIIYGEIADGKVILTKDSEGQLKELYKISKGVLYEATYEATQAEYHQCSLVNSNDTLDPIEGIYIVNVSVDQYNKAGMIISTPMPEEKRIIRKSVNGLELMKINEKAYTKVLISKSDKENEYQVKIINLDNVGFKDINCTASLDGSTLTFQYKVTYEEANKLPKNILQPGEWSIIRFSCERESGSKFKK